MTTAAWDGQMLAADTQCTDGNLRMETHKIFMGVNPDFGPYLFTYAGEVQLGHEVAAWVKRGGYSEDKPQLTQEHCFTALIITRHNCYGLEYRLEPFPVKPPIAVGSGAAIAMAAMRMGKTAEEAVRLAAEMDIYTSSAVDVARFAER